MVSRHSLALFGVLCVALGMTVSLFSVSFQISSPSFTSSPPNFDAYDLKSTPLLHSDQYALAYQESFGLFDDIPEKSWERMQQHARNYVQYWNSSDPIFNIDRTIKWYIENQEVCICMRISLGFVNGNRSQHRPTSAGDMLTLLSPLYSLCFLNLLFVHCIAQLCVLPRPPRRTKQWTRRWPQVDL
jgi:hypothetical protein